MEHLESQASDGFVPSLDNSAREIRRLSRYGALATKSLPEWTPEPIRRSYRETLFLLHIARRRRRSPNAFDVPLVEDPAREAHASSHEQQCEADLALVTRLCTYVQMKSVWETIAATPVIYPNPYRRSSYGDESVELVLSMILNVKRRFDGLAKRTPTARKKSLAGVRKAVQALVRAIEDDPEAVTVSRTFLADYFGSKNIDMRRDFDDAPSYFELCFPRTAIVPYDEYRIEALDEMEVPTWKHWPASDKYVWLNDVVQTSTLSTLLQAYDAEIELTSKEQPAIAQPGRADRGLQPFLIREISGIAHTLFGKPLDDKVALIVSAIMDLPTPLTRDGIRPYKKAAGKFSSRDR